MKTDMWGQHKIHKEIVTFLRALTVTEGSRAGTPLTVLLWQNNFVRGAFAPKVQTAALSVARGNGKSTLVAGIACAALIGPLARPRGQIIVCASRL